MPKQVASGEEFRLSIIIDATTKFAQEEISKLQSSVGQFTEKMKQSLNSATESVMNFGAEAAKNFKTAIPVIAGTASTIGLLGVALRGVYDVYDMLAGSGLMEGFFAGMQSEAQAAIQGMGSLKNASLADILFMGLDLGPPKLKAALASVKAEIYGLNEPLEAIESAAGEVQESLNFEARLAGIDTGELVKVGQMAKVELDQLSQRSVQLVVDLRESLFGVGAAAANEITKVIEALHVALAQDVAGGGTAPNQQQSAFKAISAELYALEAESSKIASGLGNEFGSKLQAAFVDSRARLIESLSLKGIALTGLDAAFAKAQEQASGLIGRVRQDVLALNQSFGASFAAAVERSRINLQELFSTLKIDPAQLSALTAGLNKAFAQAAEQGKKIGVSIAGNIGDPAAWVKFTQNADKAIGEVKARLNKQLESIGLPKDAFSEAIQFAADEFDDLSAKVQEFGATVSTQLDGIGKSAADEFSGYLADAEQVLASASKLRSGSDQIAGVKAEFAALRSLADAEFGRIGEGMGERMQEGLKAAQAQISAIFNQNAQPNTVVDKQFARLSDKAKSLVGQISQQISVLNESAGQVLGGYIDTAKEAFSDFFKPRSPASGNASADKEAQRAMDSLKVSVEEVSGAMNATLSDPKPWAKFAANALTATDRVLVFADSFKTGLGKLRNEFDELAEGFVIAGGALAGIDEPMKLFNRSKEAVSGVVSGITELVQEIGFFGQGLEVIQSLAATGPFQLLIGQNVELRQQLLSTQASLVATNQVIRDGQVLNDPKRLADLSKVDPKEAMKQQREAIQSLDAPVAAAIKSLRKKSLDLVGVTSSELVPVFQIIARFSSQLGLSMEQVADLTASTAASMGTMGIPLHQAQQEISSILSGNIDMNSVMAKNLGLSNEMVEKWKSQGKVYEELTQRLSAFRAGNELMSKTISGIGSNIQEIFDEVGRMAGEQLLDPVIKQLEGVYKYLQDNMDSIVAYGTEVVGIVLQGVEAFMGSLGTVFNVTGDLMATVPKILATALRDFLTSLANVINTLAPIVEPFVQIMTVMAEKAQAFVPIMGQLFLGGKAVQLVTGLMTEGFGTFAGALPGVGELMFLLNIRNNELVKGLIGVSKGAGIGAGSILAFATHIGKIPGGTAKAAEEIAKIHPLLGLFAPLIAEQLPAIGSLGTTLVGLSGKYEFIGNGIEGLAKKLPELSGKLGGTIDTFAPLIDKFIPGLSGQLKEATVQMGAFNSVQDLQALASDGVSAAIKGQVMSYALLAAKLTFFVAIGSLVVWAFKEWILKNKELMEVIEGVANGLGLLADMVKAAFGNPIAMALLALGSLIFALKTVGTTAAIEAAGGLWKFIIAQGMLVKGSAISALSSLVGVMKTIGLVTPAGAAAVTAFNAAAATGTVTVGSFAAAAWAAAAPLLVIAAGVAAIALIRMSKEMEGANEALEIYARNTGRLSTSAMELEKSIRDTQKAQKSKVDAGIALSEAEYKQNKILREKTKLEVQGLDTAIKDLKAAEGEMQTDEQKRNAANQIAELEARKSKLNELINTTKLAPQELPRVGMAYEQLGKQVGTALLALAKPSGEVDKYNEQAKKLLEGTQALLESGRMSVTEAVANYEKLANNEFVDKETQLNAQKGITAALKIEQERRLEDIKAVEAETQSLIEAGRFGEAKGAKLITEAKKTELDAQLANLIETKKKEDEIRKQGIENERTALDKKLQEAQNNLTAAEKGGKAEDIERAKKEYAEVEAAQTALETQAQAQQTEANRKFGNEQKKLKAEQAAVAEKQLKDAFEAKQKFVKAGEEIEQAALDRGLTSQTASAKKQLELQQQESTNELAEIKRQKALLSKDDLDGLKQLEAKESQVRAGQIKNQEAYQQKLLEIKTKAIEADQKIAEAALAKGDISDTDMASVSLELSNERLKVEEEATRKQIAMAGKNVEKRHELEGKLAEIDKNRIQALKDYYAKVIEIRTQVNEAETSILQSQIKKGSVSEKDGINRLQALANSKLDIQRQGLEQELAMAGKNVDKRRIIEGKLAQLDTERVSIAEKATDDRLALMEREAAKSQDVIKQATADRELYIQKFRLANPWEKEAADVMAAQASLKSLKGEYDQTVAMRRRLESVSYSDPKREAERQAKIRELKIRGVEQTRQLLAQEAELEQAQITKMQAAIQSESGKKVRALQAEDRALQNILSIHDSIARALTNQNRLMSARSDLENSISGYAEGQFSIAAKLEKNAEKKQQIEETAARARLLFLDRQQELERASLENELAKNKLMLDREKIQNRLEQVSARIAVEEKKAELAVLLADPKSKKSDIARAQGQLEIATSKEQLTKFKAASLDEEGALLEKESSFKRQGLKERQGLAKDNARVDLASITKTEADDEALKRESLAKAQKAVGRFKEAAKFQDDTKYATLDQFIPGGGPKVGGLLGNPADALNASKALLGQLPGNPKVDAAGGVGTTRAIEKMHADFVKGIGSMQTLLEKPGNQIDMKYSNTQIFQGGDIRGGKLAKGAEESNSDGLNRVLERARTIQRGK